MRKEVLQRLLNISFIEQYITNFRVHYITINIFIQEYYIQL